MFSTLFAAFWSPTACYASHRKVRLCARWPPGALEPGYLPGQFALGIIGRTMVVWLLESSGVPLFEYRLTKGILEMVLQDFTDIQFAYGAALIVSSATLIGGFAPDIGSCRG